MATTKSRIAPLSESFAPITASWTAAEWQDYYDTGSALSREFVAERNEHRAVGAILKEARTSRQLTQSQLSAVTGIQQGVISNIEQGTANPSLRTVFKILDATGRTLALAPAPGND